MPEDERGTAISADEPTARESSLGSAQPGPGGPGGQPERAAARPGSGQGRQVA